MFCESGDNLPIPANPISFGAIVIAPLRAADAAEASYRRSIELNPAYSETHLDLGALLASEKCFAEAEAAYRQALALKPDSPVAWSNLGALLACMKREAEAEQCYRTAMALD
jgi:Flp pilus assembly protein TadD